MIAILNELDRVFIICCLVVQSHFRGSQQTLMNPPVCQRHSIRPSEWVSIKEEMKVPSRSLCSKIQGYLAMVKWNGTIRRKQGKEGKRKLMPMGHYWTKYGGKWTGVLQKSYTCILVTVLLL